MPTKCCRTWPTARSPKQGHRDRRLHGGAEALKDILAAMPKTAGRFSLPSTCRAPSPNLFAARPDGLCKISVKEAEDEEPALPGNAYVAPAVTICVWRVTGARATA